MKTTRPKFFDINIVCIFSNTYAQITTDSNPPYDSHIFLVDSLLLGEGVEVLITFSKEISTNRFL